MYSQNIFLRMLHLLKILHLESKEDIDFRKVQYAAERAKIKSFIGKSNKGFNTR